jgi:glycosyltransferase involved in cell wall biosynthesis
MKGVRAAPAQGSVPAAAVHDDRAEERPELSAIVLCYRAGESILRVVEPLIEQLRASGSSYELVLVANYDAAGGDPTPRIVGEFARGRDDVQTVIREKRGAMGWDMRTGFEAARGSFMIVIDGDFQNPVEDVLTMFMEMKRTGADVMKGRRITRYDGWYRRFVSFAYNLLFRLLFRTSGIWDVNGKPKGLTRAAYERMKLTSDDWFIDAEIVLEARRKGLRIAELPVVFRANEERSSFVRPSAIWQFLRNMARRRLRRAP